MIPLQRGFLVPVLSHIHYLSYSYEKDNYHLHFLDEETEAREKEAYCLE